MRVIYSGGTFCSFETMQRLVLLADEIAFMDRPSVKYGNFGTVGRDSEFRSFRTDEAPLNFKVLEPPKGEVTDLYLRYLDADLKNPTFIHTVLEGLKSDIIFQNRLIQLNANYGWGTGQQVLDELLKDTSLYEGEYGSPTEPTLLYIPDTNFGRRQTLGVLLIEASIQVTNALILAEASQLIPVSDDPYFCQLIAIRAAESAYITQPVALAPMLGLEIAKSVLPNEALSKLNIRDLFEYRKSTREEYEAWSVEVDRIAQQLLDVPPDRLNLEAAKIIATDIKPRIIELQHAMKSTRDKLFGDLIKTVTKWELPTMSVAYLTGLNFPSALAAFTAALAPAVPAIVDYYVGRRDIVRRNSMAFLVGVSKMADDD